MGTSEYRAGGDASRASSVLQPTSFFSRRQQPVYEGFGSLYSGLKKSGVVIRRRKASSPKVVSSDLFKKINESGEANFALQAAGRFDTFGDSLNHLANDMLRVNSGRLLH